MWKFHNIPELTKSMSSGAERKKRSVKISKNSIEREMNEWGLHFSYITNPW